MYVIKLVEGARVWVGGLVLVAFIDFDEIFKAINAPKCMCLMAHLVTSLNSANCSLEHSIKGTQD